MMLSEKTIIGKVVLNVENMENMKNFYTSVIGLEIKNETEQSLELGAFGEEQVLLELQPVVPAGEKPTTTGLYHFAFLLPTRKDLGEILYHLLVSKYPLTGASDHGYSEALYLDDPEGNGIEIYTDKPKSMWDIRSDGQIAGVTKPMDAEGVIGEAKEEFQGMPKGTYMGHVHLFVAELEETEMFYQDVLGFDLKFKFGPQAKFFAAGEYHHQIGANVWAGKNIPAAQKGLRGLDYFTIIVTDDEFSQVKNNLDEKEYPYQVDETTQTLSLEDTNGITMKLTTNE
ncbi:VOC family protein [Carnobacterium viridans]|uniref:Catechol 2,3-dioxygenase n=1 Tax=Carnobacterium viridans TaxID=174587 RepID=A0A1H0YPU2_9LACT|nr:VOC family protein [Carnobacterium viridans]UDE95016.1 VOC family protein [Carnobacterium viridans]SDQ17088.1 catechol 2,3-dioxygenase [Carnobacterium viridans]